LSSGVYGYLERYVKYMKTIYEDKAYRVRGNKKAFYPEFHNFKGEVVMLVPTWVNQEPENWIETKQKKENL